MRRKRSYWRKSSKRTLRPQKDWSISPTRKSREVGMFSLEKKGLKWWNLINLCKHLKGGYKADRTMLFSVVPGNRRQCVQTEHQRMLFYCERDQAMEKVARRMWSPHPWTYSKAIWLWSIGNWL